MQRGFDIRMNRNTILHYIRQFLLMLLMLLIVLVPLYLGCLQLFENRQIQQVELSLNDGIRRFDQQIASLSAIASSIGSNSAYSTFARKEVQALTASDHYRLSLLQTQFYHLFLSQPYVTDYSLLFKNRITFTKERIHMADEPYYGHFLSFEGMDQEAFWERFLTLPAKSLFLPQATVHTDRHTSRAITWLCSLSPTYTRHPSGVFFATFSDQTLAQMMLPGFSEDSSGFVLYDNGNVELLRYGIAQHPQKDDHTLEAVGTQTGLHVTLLLSHAVFTHMMAPIRKLLFICLAAFLLIGSTIAILLSIRASRPIEKLVGVVHQSSNTAPYSSTSQDSFELIESAISGLDSSVDQYRTALAQQEESVRSHVFGALLHETPIPDSLNGQRRIQEFQRCFPAFPTQYRLALIMLTDEAESLSPNELAGRQMLLSALIQKMIKPKPYVYFSGKRSVLILDTTSDLDPVQSLTQMRQATPQPLLIALSDEGNGCEPLHGLYEQVHNIVRLVRHTPDKALVAVWQRQNFPDQPESITLDYDEMAQLYKALQHGEKNAVQAMLTAIGNRLTPNSFGDLVMCRQVYYGLRGILLRVKIEKFDLLKVVDIPEYNAESSIDRQFALLTDCCNRICNILYPLVSTPQSVFSEGVCRFIDDNLSSSDLSARMVADHFSISEPTLQKVIKQEKNCRFYEYVEAGRYQRAISLLTGTELSVTEIAARCGYNSPNAFHKAFKRISGMTPTAMRQTGIG